MEGNRQIGAVINGRITMDCLYLTHTPVFTAWLCFSQLRERISEHQKSVQVPCELSFYRLPLCHP